MLRITGFRDLRDWDPDLRAYVPLEPGAGNLCGRCGREHARVYEVTDTESGQARAVGSTCVKRLIAAGEFGADDVALAQRSARKAWRDAKAAALEQATQTLAREITVDVLGLFVRHSVQNQVIDRKNKYTGNAERVLKLSLGAFSAEVWVNVSQREPEAPSSAFTTERALCGIQTLARHMAASALQHGGRPVPKGVRAYDVVEAVSWAVRQAFEPPRALSEVLAA